jgi:hypothetical protein
MAAAPGALSRKGRPAVTKYVRFRHGTKTAHGILDGEVIRELRDSPFEGVHETGAKHRLAEVKLLAPCQPPKILAVGLNYRSHLGDRKAPERPEIFYKPITFAAAPRGGDRHPPRRHRTCTTRASWSVVIGKQTKDVTAAQARTPSSGSPAATTSASGVAERRDQGSAVVAGEGGRHLRPLRAGDRARGLDYGKLLCRRG